MLAGTALFLAGLAGAAPAHGAGDVIARLGPLTISVTALRPGTAGTLTTYMQVSTSGQPSDQLDAAIARTAPRRPVTSNTSNTSKSVAGSWH